MTAARRRGVASLLLLVLGAAGGLAIAGAAIEVDNGASPELKWIAGFVAGFLALLHIIKEVRYLLGHPPRRRTDDNLIQEVASISTTLGEMRSDYAALAQVVKNVGEEIDRLRDVADGLDERIGRAMSKVGSQAQTTVTNIENRLNEWRGQIEARLLLLERRRGRG